MAAEVIFTDPKTLVKVSRNENTLENSVEYVVFLQKAVLDKIEKKGIPIYSRLQVINKTFQVPIGYSKVKSGINESKSLLIFFIKVMRTDELFTVQDTKMVTTFYPLFDYLQDAGYVADFSKVSMISGGRKSRFTKKLFYQPSRKHQHIMSCENGIEIFIEENSANRLQIIAAITADIEKISYAKFKEFKDSMQTHPFKYISDTFISERDYFKYIPSEQYFVLTTTNIAYENYPKYEQAIKMFAEEICDIAKRYYPVKAKAEPVAAAPSSNPKEAIEEQIEATKLALQYSQGMKPEEIESLNEYLSSLELTLKYI